MVLTCVYLLHIHNTYDGAIDVSLSVWLVTVPISIVVIIWSYATGKKQAPAKKGPWSKVLWPIFYLCFGGLSISILYHNPYDVRGMTLLALLVLLVPFLLLKPHPTPPNSPQNIQLGALVVFVTYAAVALFYTTYLQVVQPTTVKEATALVAEQYGEDSYQYIAHLTGNGDTDPLGVYWFAQRYDYLDGWVEVDVLTGEVGVVVQ